MAEPDLGGDDEAAAPDAAASGGGAAPKGKSKAKGQQPWWKDRKAK